MSLSMDKLLGNGYLHGLLVLPRNPQAIGLPIGGIEIDGDSQTLTSSLAYQLANRVTIAILYL